MTKDSSSGSTPAPSKANDETLLEHIADGTGPDTTESNVRYAAYANRARTILRSAHRYVAYTSDIGESFRPVVHPWLIRGAYGVSWLYLTGDVVNEGYKAYTRQYPSSPSTDLKNNAVALLPTPLLEDYKSVMVQRAIFQSVASMGLPAFTIHSVVKYSARALKDIKNVRVRTWAPVGLGLAVVPFLPYLFDEPVEHAVEYSFKRGYEAMGWTAPKGVTEMVKDKEKEKEL